MRYFIVAGEASGDLHAANLIRAIRKLDPEASFAFVGGENMQKEAGIPPVVHYGEIAVMGFTSVIARARSIARAGRRMQKALLRFNPHRIVAIDSSGFNFRYLLPFSHRHFPSVPLVYYIVPKLWAWRGRRIDTLRRYCHKLLVIFPFEESYFRQRGIDASYVGNPSLESVGRFIESWGKGGYNEDIFPLSPTLASKVPIVALLPGSRTRELHDNLPPMLAAIKNYFPQLNPVIAGAPGKDIKEYEPFLAKFPGTPVVFGKTYELLASAKFALVTSGTATLETAMIGTPQVVCYRMNGSPFIRQIFKKVMKVPYFSLVNLILGKPLVGELLGSEVNGENISNAVRRMNEDLPLFQQEYDRMRKILGSRDASHEAAKAILGLKADTLEIEKLQA